MGKHLDPGTPLLAASATAARNALLRRLALVCGLFFVGAGAIFAGFAIVKHESPMQMLSQSLVPAPDQVFGKPNLLVLVEGLDYDYTANDVEFSTNSRSDIIKVVNVDIQKKNIYVLSVPRDMLATFPNGSKHKINQAQSDGGEKEASEVIASFLGIPGFDRYAVLRIDATKDIINAIGGVDVYVKTSNCLQYRTGCTGDRIDYDDTWGHLHIHFTEGLHHLNGEQAVGYGRFRHDWCSDPCRIERQDQVMTAVLDKLKNDRLNTLLNAGNLLQVIHKDVSTNFSNAELLSLGTYFSGGLTKDNLHFAEVPYSGDVMLADGDDLVPDDAGKTKLVRNMLLAPPTPEASPDAMALASIPPSTLRVDVENASGVKGAAHMVAEMLHRAGYTIGDIGNAASSDTEKTHISEHSKVAFAGAKVRSALPAPLQNVAVAAAGSDASGATPSDVTLIVGKDLASVVAPAATPSPK